MLTHCDDPRCPEEYRSIENFVEYIQDEERPYTLAEVEELGYWVRATVLHLHGVLRGEGLTFAGQAKDHKIRMANENPHTRWTDCKSHGGGGGDSIMGFAGRAG